MQELSQRKAHGTVSTNYTTDATDPNLVAGIVQGFFNIVRIMEQDISAPEVNSPSGWGSEENVITVAHGLSFVPVIIGSVAGTVNPTYVTMPDSTFGVSEGVPQWNQFEAYADNTNVYFRIRTMTVNAHILPGTFFMRIYLLEQKATSALS